MSNPLADVRKKIAYTESQLESLRELESRLSVFYGVKQKPDGDNGARRVKDGRGGFRSGVTKDKYLHKVGEVIRQEGGATSSRLKFVLGTTGKDENFAPSAGAVGQALIVLMKDDLLDQEGGKGSKYILTAKGTEAWMEAEKKYGRPF